MRPFRVLLAFLLVAALAIFFLLPWVLKERIRKGLEGAVPGSKATVGAIAFERPRHLAVSGVSVRSEGLDLSVAKVRIGTDRRVDVHGLEGVVRALPKKASASTRSAPLPLRAVHVHSFTLTYQANGIAAELKGDLEYDFSSGTFARIDVTLPSLKRGDLSLENARFRTGADGKGELGVATVSRKELRVTAISAKATLSPGKLDLTALDAAFAGGKVTGSAEIRFETPVRYTANLSVRGLDLAALGTQLDIGRKVGLGGSVDGEILLEGDAADVRRFTGKLRGTAKGGDVVIRDRATLEALAKNVRQPIELVESAFQEYHFDTAGAALALEGDDLGLEIHLDGAKGKRDLEIKLHNFL